MSETNGVHHPTDRAIDSLYSWMPAAAPAPPPLPEAPCSVNVRLVVQGYEVLWTLRDTTEGRLAARLERLLAQYPAPEPPAPTPGQDGWCAGHQTRMYLNQKGDRSWYSHRTAEGTFCKGGR